MVEEVRTPCYRWLQEEIPPMTFSLPTALEMARWCDYAYGCMPLPLGFPEAQVVSIDNPQTDIHAKLIILPDRNVLAFRGTHSLKNWMEDADCIQVEWGAPGMRVHTGFLHAFLSIIGKVEDAISSAPVNPLWITGHSLGAAMAEICAFSVVWNFGSRYLGDIVGVYPIACPRSFNLTGATQFDKAMGDRTFRVTHALDPVPHIPLVAPGFPPRFYWKTRPHVWVDDNGFMDVGRPFLQTLPHALKCGIQEYLRGEMVSIPDHRIGDYIEALERVKP